MFPSAERAPRSVETDNGGTSPSKEEVQIPDTSSHDVHTLKKMFTETKVEGGKSAWAMTLETFGMSDGKKKKGDLMYHTFDEALFKLTELAEENNLEYSYTPFGDFQTSESDLLKAYVHWSRKGEDGDVRYNTSKAFRRLEAYVEWMEKNCKGLDLRGNTMKPIQDAWKMHMTHDKLGRLVWWLDLGLSNLKYIKHQLPKEDTFRYFVWLCHLVLFDAGPWLCYRGRHGTQGATGMHDGCQHGCWYQVR